MVERGIERAGSLHDVVLFYVLEIGIVTLSASCDYNHLIQHLLSLYPHRSVSH